jgi:hypothetical protein
MLSCIKKSDHPDYCAKHFSISTHTPDVERLRRSGYLVESLAALTIASNHAMNLRLVLFIVLTLASLSGLWWLWPKPPQPVASPDAPMAEVGNLLQWQVRAGQRVAGPEKFAVRVGDTITLEIISDRDDTLHLHGDDISVVLLANKSTRMDWTPKYSGHFAMELHDSHLTLAQVDVLPR